MGASGAARRHQHRRDVHLHHHPLPHAGMRVHMHACTRAQAHAHAHAAHAHAHMHMLHMHMHTCTCHVCAHTSCLHPPARPHAHTRRSSEVYTRGVYGCSPLLLRPTQHGIDGVGGETGIADAVGPGGRVDAGLRVQPAVGRLLVFSSGSTNRYRGSYGWIDRRLPALGFGEGGGGRHVGAARRDA